MTIEPAGAPVIVHSIDHELVGTKGIENAAEPVVAASAIVTVVAA